MQVNCLRTRFLVMSLLQRVRLTVSFSLRPKSQTPLIIFSLVHLGRNLLQGSKGFEILPLEIYLHYSTAQLLNMSLIYWLWQLIDPNVSHLQWFNFFFFTFKSFRLSVMVVSLWVILIYRIICDHTWLTSTTVGSYLTVLTKFVARNHSPPSLW